ncbi:hypothetical protein WH87_11230 [Devosia epidermidihirudinis]|uniref:DUF3298 domain-containing protein n=1 Tax=Devosia epidermidihirudinis TaxID=1293439 RepID=A0A0F5QAZ1_9HYPH|nr:hypothetical protein [Devosia epidermidihirudinis]KKC38162.1 hypothetical protein WH87_11230 [Devosia epidermidihirudinis]
MRLAVLAAVLLVTTPTLAVEAVTYKGTLGNLEILAELASPARGSLVGRYSYLNKGGDIPLDLLEGANGEIRMAEEAPCTVTTCVADSNGDVTDKPIGATWTLTQSRDGATLTGTWQGAGKDGKSFPIKLERIGDRELPEGTVLTPYGIYDSISMLTYDGDEIFAPHTAPYDFAKSEVVMDAGPEETLEGSTFRYVTDPRTKFAFPRVLELADGSSTKMINEALERRHAQLNYSAFDCLAQAYAGFGANQNTAGMETGTLGGWDEESVVLGYLSPTVINWTESGSTYCTGAHPDNHSYTTILDVETGEALPLAKVFKDWVATGSMDDYGAEVDQSVAIDNPSRYFWAADKALVDYVIANRTPAEDSEYEEQCGIDELIASNLGMRFAPGDQVVFSLDGLPFVSFACTMDLLTVKLAAIPQLLAPTASEYFPDLKP